MHSELTELLTLDQQPLIAPVRQDIFCTREIGEICLRERRGWIK
jgi:hypothetical protein